MVRVTTAKLMISHHSMIPSETQGGSSRLVRTQRFGCATAGYHL